MDERDFARFQIDDGMTHIGVPSNRIDKVAESLVRLRWKSSVAQAKDYLLGLPTRTLFVPEFEMDSMAVTHRRFWSSGIGDVIADYTVGYEIEWLDGERRLDDTPIRTPYWVAEVYCHLSGGRLPDYVELMRALRRGSDDAPDLDRDIDDSRSGVRTALENVTQNQLRKTKGEWTRTSLGALDDYELRRYEVLIFGNGGGLFNHLDIIEGWRDRPVRCGDRLLPVLDPSYSFRCVYA